MNGPSLDGFTNSPGAPFVQIDSNLAPNINNPPQLNNAIETSEFYLQTKPVESAPITGANNLLQNYDLNWAYTKFSNKKVKQQLSSFISHLPGPVDTPATEDESGLMSLIERGGPVMKEIKPLTGTQLTGFRLYPGPIPEQYKVPLLLELQTGKPKKHKKKKSKKHRHHSGDFQFNINIHSANLNSGSSNISKGSAGTMTTSASVPQITSLAAKSMSSGSLVALAQSVNSPLAPSYSQDAVNSNGNNLSTGGSSSNGKQDETKKNRKRVYDERKKKKEKKKKRKKEVLSDRSD